MKREPIHAMKLSESLRGLGHIVAYYPALAAVFGMQEAIFIQQLVYWTGKGKDEEGWIYKSAGEIFQETGLSYEQQQRVRKVLGSSNRFGVRGTRVKRVHVEPIIEEKYVRTEHRMYFRVNLEALDRAFSNNLFSGMHSGAVGYYPDTHLGKAQVAPGYFPLRLYHKSTTDTPSKDIARKNAHKDFVKFFDDMSVKVRKVKPSYDAAGFRNLKLALKVTEESTLERLALYFLADSKFSKYPVDLKVFLSGGIMKAMGDQKNKEGFSKRVDDYATRFIRDRAVAHDVSGEELGSIIKSLAAKFAVPKP